MEPCGRCGMRQRDRGRCCRIYVDEDVVPLFRSISNFARRCEVRWLVSTLNKTFFAAMRPWSGPQHNAYLRQSAEDHNAAVDRLATLALERR